MGNSRWGHIQRFMERRNFLFERIEDYIKTNRKPLPRDTEEVNSIEWLLVAYCDLEIENGYDLEWKDKLLAGVPLDKFRERIAYRHKRKSDKKRESNDRRLYSRALEKINNGQELTGMERMVMEKYADIMEKEET